MKKTPLTHSSSVGLGMAPKVPSDAGFFVSLSPVLPWDGAFSMYVIGGLQQHLQAQQQYIKGERKEGVEAHWEEKQEQRQAQITTLLQIFVSCNRVLLNTRFQI